MVCLVGAIEPAEKHQGGALLRAVDGEQRRQEGHRDVVTQCGFARHMGALPASQVHDVSARKKIPGLSTY